MKIVNIIVALLFTAILTAILFPIAACAQQMHYYTGQVFPANHALNTSIGTYGYTSLKIFDILGREIATLVNEVKSPSSHIVEWDGKNSSGQKVGSGVYFYKL